MRDVVSILVLLTCAAPLFSSDRLLGQAVSSAAVSGIVRGPNLQPIARARVTLSAPGAEAAYETSSSISGAFAFSIVRPGAYVVRVESIGYRPVVATGLVLGAGSSRNLTFTLTVDPPPVTQVDTIVLASAPVEVAAGPTGGRGLGALEVRAAPHRFDDLASIVSASSWFDEGLGGAGMPGDRTLIVADGVPFYRASHPVAFTEELPAPLFNRFTVDNVTIRLDGGSMDIPGTTGTVLSVGTREADVTPAFGFGGTFSNDAGWSSSRHTFDAPGLTSWQGDVEAQVIPSPTSRLLIAGSAISQETPLAPRLDDATASTLTGIDADLVTSLSTPTVERYSRYSSLLRFDAQQGQRGQFFGRLAGSWLKRDFDALGAQATSGAAALGEESLDFSSALGHVAQIAPDLQSNVRVGFSGSRRDFTAGTDGVAPAYLVSGGAPLGAPAYAGGMSNRLDFIAIPTVRLEQDNATLTGGVSVRLSKHEFEQGGANARAYYYSDGASVGAGRGFAMEATVPGTAFGTREYSAFASYENRVSENLSVTLGARFDHEALGGPGFAENAEWLAATGLSTADVVDSFNQIGLRGLLAWNPVPDGNTTVTLSASLRDGDLDPRLVHALNANGEEPSSMRYLGAGLDWPDPAIPAMSSEAETTLTLLGPEARAPRTGIATAAIRQAFSPSTAMTVEGTYRRTDFLMRSRDLNLPVSPAASDPWGRPVWGTLTQDGSMVVTTDPGSRRFGGFGTVSALDPSGWSEYVGATVSLTHAQTALSTTASYTWSETTDNWVGAASGSMDARLPSVHSTDTDATDWTEGVSDFDATHRAAVVATLRFNPVSISTLYRFRSGRPFTPGYRAGVDANGDGSLVNDVAAIPDEASLGSLASEWSCLGEPDTFAVRNSCRGPASHSLNLRLAFDLTDLLGRPASLAFDALGLVETRDGIIDGALVLVDPAGTITTSPDGSTVTVPTIVNEDFGTIQYPTSRGRMIRIGMRIGA